MNLDVLKLIVELVMAIVAVLSLIITIVRQRIKLSEKIAGVEQQASHANTKLVYLTDQMGEMKEEVHEIREDSANQWRLLGEHTRDIDRLKVKAEHG